MEPRRFSFNSPFGACSECKGLGFLQQIDEELLITDEELTIREGAIRYFKNIVDTDNIEWQTFKILLDYYNISIDKPYKDFDEKEKEIIFIGSKEPIEYEITSVNLTTMKRKKYIEGVATLIERRYKETTSNMSREYYNSYLKEYPCPKCHGRRLSEAALSIKVGELNISEVTDLTIIEIYEFLENLVLSNQEKAIANLILKEIKSRLKFLIDVGLDYLTLSRSSGTLSGGESQRIRLATQIGSQLTGILYVLDEPSIGLHQRDNARLISSLKQMRDLGNTLIVVEHDEEIMREADFLVDIGPRAGVHGGEIVAAGTPEEVMGNTSSITGDYLAGRRKIEVPSKRREGNGNLLTIHGAKENNLKNIDVSFKVGALNVVTGVSGSGKSTLINEILLKSLSKKLNKSRVTPGKCDSISGMENFERVINIDQSPIGRTPRSNPATYTGVFDNIRELFAETTEAKMRGYSKGRFSFNVKGGRCERCWGDGVIKIECIFFLMYMFLVRNVMELDIIVRH